MMEGSGAVGSPAYYGENIYDAVLPRVIEELDPGRAYIPTSPLIPSDETFRRHYWMFGMGAATGRSISIRRPASPPNSAFRSYVGWPDGMRFSPRGHHPRSPAVRCTTRRPNRSKLSRVTC